MHAVLRCRRVCWTSGTSWVPTRSVGQTCFYRLVPKALVIKIVDVFLVTGTAGQPQLLPRCKSAVHEWAHFGKYPCTRAYGWFDAGVLHVQIRCGRKNIPFNWHLQSRICQCARACSACSHVEMTLRCLPCNNLSAFQTLLLRSKSYQDCLPVRKICRTLSEIVCALPPTHCHLPGTDPFRKKMRRCLLTYPIADWAMHTQCP